MFFLQAEDGIRDIGVTGVQTCTLPICISGWNIVPRRMTIGTAAVPAAASSQSIGPSAHSSRASSHASTTRPSEIGRASCRERVEISVVAGSLNKKHNTQNATQEAHYLI